MSTFWSLLDAVRTTLQTLPGLDGVAVAIRKHPYHSADHGDALPLVVVSPDGEEPAGYAMERVVQCRYGVLVTLFQAKTTAVQTEAQLQWQLARRQEVRDALLAASLGGLTFADFGYDPSPAFDASGLAKAFDLSVQGFRYTVTEERDGP